MLAKRKREILDERAEGEDQTNKKRHTSPDGPISSAIPDTTDSPEDVEILEISEIISGDDEMPNFDTELLLVSSDDEEDSKMIDEEPEQGPILWSEDQEEFPPCAIYHEDVKQYQARITEFTVDLADHLSKIRDKGGDMTRLYTEAVSNQAFPEPKKQIVTLMGDAGSGMTCVQDGCNCTDHTSGKSSLINSILDTPHVAKEVWYLSFPLLHDAN
jgi:hypothetical protein